MKLIKLFTLVFLLFTSLLNAQNLLMFPENKPELNTNVSLDFSYIDLLSGWNFTSGSWATLGAGTTKNDLNSFTTIVAGGVRINNILTVNELYNIVVSGSTTATRLDLYNYALAQAYKTNILANVHTFLAIDNGISLYNTAAGITDITLMSLKKLISPTGFTSATMNATNYVIEDSGCKLIEATGETKITMSDTLTAGYYKLKVTQDWTQGKLWAYNGTTTYNFPQSDGEYIVKIYLPGNKPLVIGCDNNTISILESLSIK